MDILFLGENDGVLVFYQSGITFEISSSIIFITYPQGVQKITSPHARDIFFSINHHLSKLYHQTLLKLKASESIRSTLNTLKVYPFTSIIKTLIKNNLCPLNVVNFHEVKNSTVIWRYTSPDFNFSVEVIWNCGSYLIIEDKALENEVEN